MTEFGASVAAERGMAIETIFAHVSCSAGASTLTLGVLPLEPERERLEAAGLAPGAIEEAESFFIMRLRDPDQNLVVLASAKRS